MPDEFSTHNPQQHEEPAHLINRISGDLETTVMKAHEREPGVYGVRIRDELTGEWSISEESFPIDQVFALCAFYVRADQYLRIERLDGTTHVYQPYAMHPLVDQIVTVEAA